MSEKKPTPMLGPSRGAVCPICGQRSYSRDGIHPQCAVKLADMPKKERQALALKQAAHAAKLAAKVS
jgi:hypothetical protein